MLPARINIFYSKISVKPTGECKGPPPPPPPAPKKKIIINFSSKAFTDRRINLLRRGFTPISKTKTIELKNDIQDFTPKLRLIDSFQETRESVSGPLVKNKSNFNPPPPRNRNKFLDTTIGFINQQNLNGLRKNKTNLSKEDWQALKELKITEVCHKREWLPCKGKAVFIMDSVHYKQMIYKQLEDKITYKKRSIL